MDQRAESRKTSLKATTEQLRTFAQGSETARLLKELLIALEEHYAHELIDEVKKPHEIRGAAQAMRQLRLSIFAQAEHPPQPHI